MPVWVLAGPQGRGQADQVGASGRAPLWGLAMVGQSRGSPRQRLADGFTEVLSRLVQGLSPIRRAIWLVGGAVQRRGRESRVTAALGGPEPTCERPPAGTEVRMSRHCAPGHGACAWQLGGDAATLVVDRGWAGVELLKEDRDRVGVVGPAPPTVPVRDKKLKQRHARDSNRDNDTLGENLHHRCFRETACWGTSEAAT